MGQAYGNSERQQTKSNNGSDIRYDLTITLEEAFTGTKKPIKFNTLIICDKCNRRGHENNQPQIACPNVEEVEGLDINKDL